MRNFFTLFTFSILSIFSAHAQTTGRVTGIINDENGKPVLSATVSLLKAKDSALVKVAISDKSGLYEFMNIPEGSYLITATSVGFAKAASKTFNVVPGTTIEVPSLTLLSSATSMAGVTVQATRPLIENKIDKMVVNVDASPSNAGATAMEVLEKSPGITVDRDGNISLKGKQ